MEQTTLLLGLIGAYFLVLFLISLWTGRKADGDTFFRGKRSSPWYVVAFGMIGASLSGVTFISVPGWVATQQFAYMQIVLGYVVGSAVISFILLPLYYRYNLTSIYTYLRSRFGEATYKTGALFFLVSRILGASFRLYLVAMVLDEFVLGEGKLGLPFELTVAASILLIWIYTFRGGIRTVVWTDTLQTFFMLAAAGLAVYTIYNKMEFQGIGEMWDQVAAAGYAKTFFWDVNSKYFFGKQFVSGAFIAIAMTGLDQDMMQKNLTCRSLGDAQKNMMSLSIVLVFVNLGFLLLGALLFMYGTSTGIVQMTDAGMLLQSANGTMVEAGTDTLFPYLALNHMDSIAVVIMFVIGLVAAAYSSADSALTALTTSFCIDFLDFERRTDEAAKKRLRNLVHISMSLVLFFAIIIFNLVNDSAVIGAIFAAAAYTYGPLLGLYAFGLFTKFKLRDELVPVVALAAPILLYFINLWTKGWLGFATLPVNGALTFVLLLLLIRPEDKSVPATSAN